MSLGILYHHRNISVSLCLIDIQVEKHYSPTNFNQKHSRSPSPDIWMSSSTEAYISLTCHFLTSQWEFVDCALATRSFPDHHTGENISSTIKEVLEAYEIADSTVSSIVHDQGSNMRRATDLLQIEKGWTRVNCSAHILQLCIGDGFKNNASIDRALGAARRLVGHFHHSTLAMAELYKQQSQMNMDQQKLKMDCTTRWNSTLYMIQCLVANRWPVRYYCYKKARPYP